MRSSLRRNGARCGSGKEVEKMKPIYCTNEQADNCRECSFSNYGRDCQNERIQDDEEHHKKDEKI